MFNRATQRHVCHLLLIDTESASVLRALVRNAEELYHQFCRIAMTPSYDGYTLHIVFPELRGDIHNPEVVPSVVEG